MNEFIGTLNTKETIEASGEWRIKGILNTSEKSNYRSFKFYRNKNVITCVIKTNGNKAIGIAKCNPKDNFDYYDGIILAELRARENLYKITIEKYINKMKIIENAMEKINVIYS